MFAFRNLELDANYRFGTKNDARNGLMDIVRIPFLFE